MTSSSAVEQQAPRKPSFETTLGNRWHRPPRVPFSSFSTELEEFAKESIACATLRFGSVVDSLGTMSLNDDLTDLLWFLIPRDFGAQRSSGENLLEGPCRDS